MKLSVLLASACIVLTGSLTLALAQSGPPSHLLSMSAWSRPSVVSTCGIQMRSHVDAQTLLSPNGASVVMRFEPIPHSTIASMQQMAAANHNTLAYTQRKISAAFVTIDVVGDSAPPMRFKAVATSTDPSAFEVVLPAPSGGWYNQPLRVEVHVFADDQEILSSDSTITLAP